MRKHALMTAAASAARVAGLTTALVPAHAATPAWMNAALAPVAGASPLIANRTAIGPWEEFDLIHD